MKKLLFVICSVFLFLNSKAQYDVALGVMYAKDGMGLTYKQFIQPEQNIQVNFLYNHDNYTYGGLLVGLFEFHKEIHASTLHTTQLSWSFGGGLHTGYWATKGNNLYAAFKIGVDAVAGLEYNFDFIPITIGAQVRPYVQYNTDPTPDPLRYYNVDYGLMLRYIIR